MSLSASRSTHGPSQAAVFHARFTAPRGRAAARNTDSASARRPDGTGDRIAERAADVDATAEAMPFNANKPFEYGYDNAHAPQEGEGVEPPSDDVGASTLSEVNASDKLGTRARAANRSRSARSIRVRTDATARRMTTNQGVPVSDNQHSLKAGLRGPALLKDFVLREKITHFDHERIPERIVHARGCGAHGFFECYAPLTDITRAAPFQAKGKITPVFVRFSTVQGERGSKDTARDVRGFAVKFYTDEGNWDLVGNNIPVFFIQDAMKFPDLVHAVKPEPHHAMPQAASAHDTFWDFVSLMPESTHMLMWVMSDRAIPRCYPHDAGLRRAHLPPGQRRRANRVFVQVPLDAEAGHACARVGRGGQDLRRRSRLTIAAICGKRSKPARIRSTNSGVQIFTEEDAARYSFDILDATKIVPGGTGARAADRPHGAQSQSRQLLRRDRTGRVLHRARRAGHRLHERSAAGRPHPFLRRHADLAARRPELPRDPDQRADRAGAQQPARRHASAGDPSRSRRVRTQLPRRRLSVPGRRGGLRVVPASR